MVVTNKYERGIYMARQPVELITDPSVVPTDRQQIGMEFIKNYCKQDTSRAKWLITIAQKKEKDKNGEERPISWHKIKKAFIDKYFPELGKKKVYKKKAPSKRDEMIEELKALLGE